MSIVALTGSDRYGMVGGLLALALGPVVYLMLRIKGNVRT
jgi:hypothetical protein